ncbi:restriction endonuclease subunit S [Vibrio metschnikovii]|uniref:restriction endonuclease subunit S n=1 Tax=Vibrio metschnikovii TaxID=28172 RepID=UPI002FCB6A6D
MVPNGWNSKPLVQLLEKIIDYRGQSVPKSSSGIPLITARNVRDGYLDFSNQEYVDESKFEEWMTRGIPQKGDILFTTEAPLGKACRYPSEGMYAVGQRTVTLRTNKKLDSEFLLYTILSERGQLLIDLRSSGSTAKGIKSSELKKVKIAYPESLLEQRKIAKILSTWDKAITTTEQLIAASQQQKKALMQQLLTGKKRLLNPETGKVFEGDWEEVAVSQFGSVVSGGTPSTENPSYWNGNVDWVTPTDITKLSTRTINKTARTITEQGLKNSSAKLVPAGSLLVCTRATIGEIAISQHEMCTNQGFKNLIPNKKTNIDFLYYLMCFEKHKLVSKASGSTFLELSKKDFEHIRFVVPQVNEQQKIASVLTAADKEIELLQAKLAHLKEEKKALMQQLLTGKRRVKIEEMEIA